MHPSELWKSILDSGFLEIYIRFTLFRDVVVLTFILMVSQLGAIYFPLEFLISFRRYTAHKQYNINSNNYTNLHDNKTLTDIRSFWRSIDVSMASAACVHWWTFTYGQYWIYDIRIKIKGFSASKIQSNIKIAPC